MFDHQIVHPYPLTISHLLAHAAPPFPPSPNVHLPVDLSVQLGYTDAENASVWGPTCDSIDSVRQLVRLPKGLDVGDWLGWGEMGAYTLCAASTFNGLVAVYWVTRAKLIILLYSFERSPVHWTTGGTSRDAVAVRAILDAFAGPDR